MNKKTTEHKTMHYAEREVQFNLAQRKNKTGNSEHSTQRKDTAGSKKFRDSSAKLIFDAPILCAQFLRGYVNIPLPRNVQPEDIEDETERFVHMFTEERDSDVVKKIHIKEEKTPFYLVFLY